MTEPDLAVFTEKLEQLGLELRRQGRAAVAAQAAAESCLSGVEQLDAKFSAREHGPTSSTDSSLLPSLFPLFDALQRVAAQAEALNLEEARAWPWSLFRPSRKGARLRNLSEGVRLLEAAFLQAMEGLGVVIEHRVGVELDPNIHRVVEAREPSVGEAPGTVVKVVRCGYLLQGNVLREADVVATRNQKRSEN